MHPKPADNFNIHKFFKDQYLKENESVSQGIAETLEGMDQQKLIFEIMNQAKDPNLTLLKFIEGFLPQD